MIKEETKKKKTIKRCRLVDNAHASGGKLGGSGRWSRAVYAKACAKPEITLDIKYPRYR